MTYPSDGELCWRAMRHASLNNTGVAGRRCYEPGIGEAKKIGIGRDAVIVGTRRLGLSAKSTQIASLDDGEVDQGAN